MNAIHHAIVICPVREGERDNTGELLGLSVGERLLLSLEKGGVTHAAFVGEGSRPASTRTKIEIVSAEFLLEMASHVVAVPADLVFDPSLLSDPSLLTDVLPVRVLPPEGARDLVQTGGAGLAGWSRGSDESGGGLAGRGFAIRVSDDRTKRQAESALLKSLQKSADGIVSRNLNRKISTAISRRLASYPVKPNHVTAVVFLVGVCSGPLVFSGTYLGLAAGGFCYWFSAVLDGCDGELSRLKYLGTPLGAWLDTITDDVVCLSFVIGMYAALARGTNGDFWTWIGILGLSFYLLTLLPRYYVMLFRLGSGDYQKLASDSRPDSAGPLAKLALVARDTIFRTDFMPFAAMVTAMAGQVQVFALPFAVGSVASAVDSVLTVVKYRPAE